MSKSFKKPSGPPPNYAFQVVILVSLSFDIYFA